MNRVMAVIWIGCVALLIVGCNGRNEPPEGFIAPEKMQQVLWDIARADAYTWAFVKRDSSKNAALENAKLQQAVFTLHKVSKENFYTSYAYYTKNPELMKPLLDSINVKANRDLTNKINHPPLIPPAK